MASTSRLRINNPEAARHAEALAELTDKSSKAAVIEALRRGWNGIVTLSAEWGWRSA